MLSLIFSRSTSRPQSLGKFSRSPFPPPRFSTYPRRTGHHRRPRLPRHLPLPPAALSPPWQDLSAQDRPGAAPMGIIKTKEEEDQRDCEAEKGVPSERGRRRGAGRGMSQWRSRRPLPLRIPPLPLPKQQDGEAPYAEGNDAMIGHIISTTIGDKNGEPKQTISYMAEHVVGTSSFGIVFQQANQKKDIIADGDDEDQLEPLTEEEQEEKEQLLEELQRSGTVPGVGLVHAPFSLLPTRFPASSWKQACELAPIFNELVDRVSLDGEFLQDSLSRTKEVDNFTARLLEIHSKMMAVNKEEDIRLGLHRSDYMLDSETNSLLQIELNTISTSFPCLGSLVSELHRTLLNQYGEVLSLDSRRIPRNWAASQFAEAVGRAWAEYNNDSAVVMMIVQPEERNMYDQYWLINQLKESCGVTTIRKTLAQVEAEGQVLPDGTLMVGGWTVAVVYFRAGYAPNDYPSEAEWSARLLMEQSSAIKCPSISYHLVGTKKIQQELAKPNVLERFVDKKDDIVKLRKCFAGLWSLDNKEIVRSAIEKPDLFVLKPQREGGGNNMYGHDLQETLVRLEKEQGEALAAYILMQRIFPKACRTQLVQGGVCFEDLTISELGIYGAYLRNKDNIVMNDQCGYLMRTKVSSSNEGGVAAGFAVLDSILLTD